MPHPGGAISAVLTSAIERKVMALKFANFGTATAMAVAAYLSAPYGPALAAEFPFDQEMLLDAKPLPGSKRVPILDIGADGRTQVDLWCRSGVAQVEVNGDSFRFAPGPLREEGCTPERTELDQQLIAALSQVTQWRVEEDVVVLTGPMELRFFLSTH